MVPSMASHAIAPAAVLRGDGAWGAALPKIAQLCRNPLLLGRSPATQQLREQLSTDLKATGLHPSANTLQFDCCELDLQN